MHPRSVLPLLRSRLRQYPAAVLVGPRQCGKTTLARSLGGIYFDLEQEAERVRLDIEWPRLVQRGQRVILGEAAGWTGFSTRSRGKCEVGAVLPI